MRSYCWEKDSVTLEYVFVVTSYVLPKLCTCTYKDTYCIHQLDLELEDVSNIHYMDMELR